MTSGTKQRAQAARERIRRQRATERRRRSLFTTAVVAALLLLAGVIGYGVYVTQQPSDVPRPQAAVDHGTGLAVGDGPVTVELYLDFLCPACRAYEQQAAPVLDRYLAQGRITLVYHPVNFLDGLTSTDYSTRAAAAAAVAADEGRLREYVAALFEHQPAEHSAGLSDEELIGIGRSVGLTSESFARAVRGDRYHDWVAYVTREADRRGVRGTPTVFVDGHQISNTVTALKSAIDAA